MRPAIRLRRATTVALATVALATVVLATVVLATAVVLLIASRRIRRAAGDKQDRRNN
jgi:hypothetical protein